MKYSFFTALLIILFNFISPAIVGQQWSNIQSPTKKTLYGLACADMNTWIAVGSGGTIIRGTDAGLSWTEISSPVTDDLRSVSFNGNTGIAVGISGRILRSTNGGLNWVLEQRITTKNLYAVSMGKYSTVIGGHEGTILYSTDDGVTWDSRTAGTASQIFGVSVFDSTAVGAGGQGAIIMSINAGNAWGLTVLGNNLTFFSSVSFINNRTGWMVGTSAAISSIIIRSDLSGFVWNAQTSPVPDALNGVCFVNIDSGTAAGANGAIIHTVNGGINWEPQISGVSANLNAVSLSDSIGIAVGDSGTIVRTFNPYITGVEAKSLLREPRSYFLEQNYPNPFNPNTVIGYRLSKNSHVSLKVYDFTGNEVAVLVNEEKAPGEYRTKFNAQGLSSGIYFYRLNAGSYMETKKMMLLK